jgi:serine/threonine protein kinase/DNA-binding winged helix-turn-helix (wHTH) protein
LGTEILGGEFSHRLTAGRRWRFGDAVLDEASLELFVAGRPVKIERKPLEVLLYLLNNVSKVVTKEELQSALWAGRILTESVLTRTVSQLRQALGDAGREVITTVHGFGYKLSAEVTVETIQPQVRAPIAFAVGTPLPWKPHWRLVEKLGSGGSGEAWLARHEKTREAVVVKFATTGAALSSFRREAAISRVIWDALGEHAPVALVKDWGLDREPYYLEIEYVDGRDLQSWAISRGGLENVPLSERLEVVSQIADALSQLHAIGVLHRDLKPANVLLNVSPTGSIAPKASLSDFGSGALIDPDLLARLNITNLGLTQDGLAAGTAYYIAPEVLSGQPVTARADIFSLGVILYQMIVGSFQKTLAPGWEREISDDLLIEDVANAAAGDPAVRLSDAAVIAANLRTLDQRRLKKIEEAERTARAQRVQHLSSELRRARQHVGGLFVLAVIAVTVTVFAYRKTVEATRANETSAAVNAFLTDDLLGIDPSIEKPSQASYQSLLEKASTRIDERFLNRPEPAATLHMVMARRFQEIGEFEQALAHYRKASELQTALHGNESFEVLLAEERAANMLFAHGDVNQSFSTFQRLIAAYSRRNGPNDLSTLLLRERVARLEMIAGNYGIAESEFREILRNISAAPEMTTETRTLFREWFGLSLMNDTSYLRTEADFSALLKAQTEGALGVLLVEFMGDYAEGELLLRDAISIYSSHLETQTELTAEHLLDLSFALALQQRFEESERALTSARHFFDKWLPPKHWLRAAPLSYLFALRSEEQKWPEALTAAKTALDLCALTGCPTINMEDVRYDFGVALMRADKPLEAAVEIGLSLQNYERRLGRHTLGSLRRRISLTNCYLLAARDGEAEDLFASISAQDLAALPRKEHLTLGEYKMVEGLLAMHRGERTKARNLFNESQEIFEKRLGTKHWKTRQVAERIKNV